MLQFNSFRVPLTLTQSMRHNPLQKQGLRLGSTLLPSLFFGCLVPRAVQPQVQCAVSGLPPQHLRSPQPPICVPKWCCHQTGTPNSPGEGRGEQFVVWPPAQREPFLSLKVILPPTVCKFCLQFF